MAIQIGKYKRPGIFIEEFDNSVISSPTVTGITNTVIGVSKKGPVNTPVLLSNVNDLQNIFGPLDTQLERKGSFFHRTISNMLQSSPVYAINLLLTDDTLDQIEYQSLSSATTIVNDVERLAPYRRFFDTTGFWKRDTQSFLNILEYPTPVSADYQKRLLNFTNLSDKYVTIFVFKSQVNGFDRNMLEWYGAVEKMPPYVYTTDLASDYLVDVLIVAGDYSDYKSLSVDARFSNYFDPTGLRKTQVGNFANDRNITTLAYLQGLSLIPYFRDLNGNNIFIETVINRNTDKHGVFCAFNSDLFETDYPTGLVDLIGNNLVSDDLLSNPPTSGYTNYGSLDSNDGTSDGEVSINFLSYNDKITQSDPFTQKVLDRPGNVMALFGGTPSYPNVAGSHAYLSFDMDSQGNAGGIISGDVNSTERTYWFSEGYVNDLYLKTLTPTGATISIVYDVDPTSKNGYAVINGQYVKVTNTQLTSGTNGVINLVPSYYSSSLTSTQSFRAAVVVDTTGTIKVAQTTIAATTSTLANLTCFPLVNATDIVLGYASFSCYAGSFVTSSFHLEAVTLTSSVSAGGSGDTSYISLTYGTASTDGFNYQITGSASFKVEFPGTNTSPTPRDYKTYRKFKTFNNLLSYIHTSSSYKGCILLDPLKTLQPSIGSEKQSLALVSVTNIVTTTTLNKSFVINASLGTPTNTSTNVVVADDYVDNYFSTVQDVTNIATSALPLVFYKVDDEFILGTEGVETKPTIAGTMGVAGRYSSFYTNFEDGQIETEDVIYQKVNFSPVQTYFITGSSVTASIAGYNYVVFGVNNQEKDYLGNLNTTIISNNKDFFNILDGKPDYMMLMAGSLNSGKFTTQGDEGLDPSQNSSYAAGGGTLPVGPMDRADIIDAISGNVFGFSASNNLSGTYSYYAFQVAESVTDEFVASMNNIFSYNDEFPDAPIYLEMYIDSNLNLKAFFKNSDFTSMQTLGSIVNGPSDPEQIKSNNTVFVKSFVSNYKETVQVEQPSGYTRLPNKILVRGSRYANLKVGDFLEAYYDENALQPNQMPKKLTRIVSKKTWTGDASLVEVTCDSEIKLHDYDGYLETSRYMAIDNYASTYKAISLKGFRVRQDSLPDGTETKQSAILDLVAKGTPLFGAITNKESFDFRYLIDSFGLGLTERSKQQLVDICGQRLDCFGILNMPSMRSFRTSSSPSFVDSNGVLQTSYIAAGGDPESNPAFLYSFGDGVGVSSVGYFTPYLTVNDNGRPTEVPPSSFVALTYMRKQNSTVTSITPWTIAAGVTNGRITNIAGLEMDFSTTDIENLNQAQMNPIVFKRNRGYVIETENTAQTLYKSALSYIHVREVLIELERELSSMLLDFQWKYNTPEIRSEIKLRADVICEKYVSKNGLYNYFNKCDAENNTSEIIDNQIGVLDTYVEPIRGMGIIVNNITILRTGAIQAGGFITA